MYKKRIALFIAAGALLASANSAFGAVNCVTQPGVTIYGGVYGGGQICVRTGELQINKEVFNPNPKVKKFVDNITLENPDTRYTFAPGEEIVFKLKIKNTGDNTLDRVRVTDTLPGFLEPVAGDYSFEITNLQAGQEVVRELKSRVVAIDKLPKDKSLICDVNQAEAVSGDMRDTDTAGLCAEKKAVGELPKAGATDTFAVLFSSGLLGFFGLKFLSAGKTVKA